MAQRRATRAVSRQGRSRAWRRSAAHQRLPLQGGRPVRLSLPGRCPHPPDEPARHRREHAAPEDDPARRHLRSAPAGGRAGRWRGAGNCRVHRLRQPDSAVRVHDERLGQRSAVQGSRQRAGPDDRHPRRHVRHDDSKTAHSETDQRSAGVHHNPRRRLFLPAWHQRAAVSGQRRIGARVMRSSSSPRTYNQVQVPRPYTAGKRRFSIYWTWSYPWESQRDVTEMDNRFSTITEVRRVAWPTYEAPEYSAQMFLQGIAGTLELFHLSLLRFQQLVGETTGHPVAVYQRVDQAGQKLPIDAGILDDTDTLMVFGLDHLVTEQEAASEEIEAIREWLKREGTCLILGPHHDVGGSSDLKERAMEYAHHRDPLVPRQQRFGQYTRSVMQGLGVPVRNQYGLRPATVGGSKQLQPLLKRDDLDVRGWLEGVETFNFHPHLPHYAITTDTSAVHLLAQQPIDLSRPHPFTEAGHREFNMFLWMPPNGDRAGDVMLADSTIFSTLFGGDESLENFWRNIATAK